MGKIIRRMIAVVLILILIISTGMIIKTKMQYKKDELLYENTAASYTSVPTETPAAGSGTDSNFSSKSVDASTSSLSGNAAQEEEEVPKEYAPITVDFDALKAVGSDIVGWIYCPDTIINFPVVKGSDNTYYLKHSYDGEYCYSGSIFVEQLNSADFSDPNTIIYGHNMKDGLMFGKIDMWADQSYYDAHPDIWLLTPERDYKIRLFSGYTTPAGSDSYQVFSDFGEDFSAYLSMALEQSDFVSPVEPGEEDCCVMLSTCAYVFTNARYVLHGVLQPLDSAGGIPLE